MPEVAVSVSARGGKSWTPLVGVEENENSDDLVDNGLEDGRRDVM